MLKIAHRVNTLEQLGATPRDIGVEMDLHAYGSRIVVHHDAFQDSIDFEAWLDAYAHAFVILNVKEEGIEGRVRDAVLARGIENFFLLDLSFPALMKLVVQDESRIAVRVSEYESVAGAVSLAGRVEWVWLDVFHGFPLDAPDYQALRDAGLNLCLVSPELHGRDIAEIASMQETMARKYMTVDAVCTKRPDLW